MPILNKAKGVYRGRALVQFVRVAGRVIWQARKIVGWNKIAGPYTVKSITSIASRKGEITFKDKVKDEFEALKSVKDLYLKGDDGQYYNVKRVDPSTYSNVYIDVNVENTIAKKGSRISFYQPVWG